MNYLGRLEKFERALIERKLDGFAVTHPANLRYLCGYSGSNGLLLWLAGRRVFFTDGRLYPTGARGGSGRTTTVRLKVEQNQLVGIFSEIRVRVDGLKGA